MRQSSSGLPARTLVHPGPPSAQRLQSCRSKIAQHFRLTLPPKISLQQAIVDELYARSITSASLTILGGWFESLQYCVAPPDPLKEAVIRYSAPKQVVRSQFIFGNATLGFDDLGKPIVHCHAAFTATDGDPRGGHIIASQSFIGANPLFALVTTLEDFDLHVGHDKETNIPLLAPVSKLQGAFHE